MPEQDQWQQELSEYIRQAVEVGTMEADIVSARITELPGEKTFRFSPAELQSIHERLFSGVFDHAASCAP